MHTYEQCKIKIQGIKTLLTRIKEAERDHDVIHVADSAMVMCDELLREDVKAKKG